ncbi:MAG TPA: NAD(P)/FAD-dependent oxidoreductase [Negativicutes bacterium]|nr:NAD(P)/FAD-dependent oxidoreductase [Negativicutes bacterium]
MVDVCIIGAGTVGMNVARELMRYRLKVCCLDKEDDVSCGCSKANSGIVHGGYSDEPGTLKARFCVAGNRMYEKLEQELHFGYRETGSLVLAFQPEEIEQLKELYQQGVQNGVGGLAIIDGDEARRREPYLSEQVVAALYCQNAGVTSPYEFVIALAENAVENGLDLRLNTKVTGIEVQADKFRVLTNGEVFEARYIVNAAGIYSDAICRMVGIEEYVIHPRRGQYIVLDKEQNHLVRSVIFQVPTKMGKGILVTTTYHGNLMIGPNAEEITDKDDLGTDEKTLEYIAQTARKSVPGFDLHKALTSFAGNRPVVNRKDFIVEEGSVKKMINLVGIDSPGLTSSPAIAVHVVELLQQAGLELAANSSFQPNRRPIIRRKPVDFAGKVDHADPDLDIICRCEQVTRSEIKDCLHRGIPVQSLDAVRRRTRAGQGMCQGAFCGPRVRKLIAEELGISPEAVTARGAGSSQLAQRAKRIQIVKL